MEVKSLILRLNGIDFEPLQVAGNLQTQVVLKNRVQTLDVFDFELGTGQISLEALKKLLDLSPRTFKKTIEACGLNHLEKFNSVQVSLILECRNQVKSRKTTYEKFGARLDEYVTTI